MTVPIKNCGHKTIGFQSGDYYIFCRDCPAFWVMVEPNTPDLKSSTVSNLGTNCQLSGQNRVTEHDRSADLG